MIAAARLALRPLTPPDYDAVYRWASTPGVGDHWRLAERPPTPEQFVEDLWRGVLRHDLVCRGDGEPIALVTAYDANHRNGAVWLALLACPDHVGDGLAVAGAALLVDMLFREWPFRMVRFEAFAFSLRRFSALTEVARVDGVLRADRWYDGAYHDQVLMSVTRESWLAYEGALGTLLQRVMTVDPACAGQAAGGRPGDDGLSFEDFVLGLRKCGIGLEAAASPQDRLDDLGLDSIEVLELVEALETLARTRAAEELPTFATLGDAYQWYRTRPAID